MNKARRKEIEGACQTISEGREFLDKAVGKFDDARQILESVRDEEQDYFDNMPENMQSGEKGSAAEQAVSELEDATNHIDEGSLDEYIEKLQEVQDGLSEYMGTSEEAEQNAGSATSG